LHKKIHLYDTIISASNDANSGANSSGYKKNDNQQLPVLPIYDFGQQRLNGACSRPSGQPQGVKQE
jgi:hypothetical protein